MKFSYTFSVLGRISQTDICWIILKVYDVGNWSTPPNLKEHSILYAFTVKNDPSVGGSYTGVEPMGLVWGVEPSPEAIKDWPRLVKKNIMEPFVYHFRVEDEGGRELASTSVERWYLADYVERILVTHGKADGCLYLPNKKGNFYGCVWELCNHINCAVEVVV